MKSILNWVKKYKDTVNLITNIVLGFGTLVTLVFLIIQTRTLQTQTQILSGQYSLVTRPYLKVVDITTQDGDGPTEKIYITLRNFGQGPTTQVNLQKVMIGGADVTYDKYNGTYIFSYTGGGGGISTSKIDKDTGVSVAFSGGFVTALQENDYPADFIFYPGLERLIIASVNKPTYEDTVLRSKVMHVWLEYVWNQEQYYCITKANLQGNRWEITEETRGN
jgi:hypothetical protein